MQQPHEKKSALVEAIENKDIRMVEENLMLCVHDNYKVFIGFCAACKSGDMNLVKIFTDNEHITDSILIEISESERYKSLLQKDDPQKKIAPSSVFAACHACLGGNLEIVKLFYEEESALLKKMYNAVFGTALMPQELQIASRDCALISAASEGHVEVVKFFMKNFITADDAEDVSDAIKIALINGQKKPEKRCFNDVVVVLLGGYEMPLEKKIALVREVAEKNNCSEFGEKVIKKMEFSHKVCNKFNNFWHSVESRTFHQLLPELQGVIKNKFLDLEVSDPKSGFPAPGK